MTYPTKQRWLATFCDRFLQEQNIKWLLVTGVLILVASTGMFVGQDWHRSSPLWKICVLFSTTWGMELFGWFAWKSLGLRKTGTSLLTLTLLLIPLDFLAIRWTDPGNEIGLGTLAAFGTWGLVLLIVVGYSSFRVARVLQHFLRAHRPVLLVSYLTLAFAGAFLAIVPPFLLPALALVLWGVMVWGARDAQQQVFWLTREWKLPRVCSVIPVLILGGQYAALMLLSLPAELLWNWNGLGLVLLALALACSTDALFRMLQQEGGTGAALPAPLSLTILGAPVLAIAGTGQALAVFPACGAVVPAALLTAVTFALIAWRTGHAGFVWGMLLFVTIGYQCSPVFFRELARSLIMTGAAVVQEQRLPIAFYGMTYLPLLLGVAGLGRVLELRGIHPFSRPLRQFSLWFPVPLLCLSLTHSKAMLPVGALLLLYSLLHAVIWRDRSVRIVMACAWLTATAGVTAFCSQVLHLPLAPEQRLMIWPVAAVLPLLVAALPGIQFNWRLPEHGDAFSGVPVGRWTSLCAVSMAWGIWQWGAFASVQAPVAAVLILLVFTMLAVQWQQPWLGMITLLFGLQCGGQWMHACSLSLPWWFLGAAGAAAGLSALEWGLRQTGAGGTLSRQFESGQYVTGRLWGRRFLSGQAVARQFVIGQFVIGQAVVRRLEVPFAGPAGRLSLLACFLVQILLLGGSVLSLLMESQLVGWIAPLVFLALALQRTLRTSSSLLLILTWLQGMAFCGVVWTQGIHGPAGTGWLLCVWGAMACIQAVASRRFWPQIPVGLQVSPLPLTLERCLRLTLLLLAVLSLSGGEMAMRLAGGISLLGLLVLGVRRWSEEAVSWLLVLANLLVLHNILAGWTGQGLLSARFLSLSFWTVERASPLAPVLSLTLAVLAVSWTVLFWRRRPFAEIMSPIWQAAAAGIMALQLVNEAMPVSMSQAVLSGLVFAILAGDWLGRAILLARYPEIGNEVGRETEIEARAERLVWRSQGILGLGVLFECLSLQIPWTSPGMLFVPLGLALVSWLASQMAGDRFEICRQPWKLTALALPAVTVMLGVMRHFYLPDLEWIGFNSMALFVAAGVYFCAGLEQRKLDCLLLSALSGNIAFALLWRELSWSDPELFLLPVGLSLLGLGELLQLQLPVTWHDPVRYVGALTILGAPALRIGEGDWISLLLLMVLSVGVILLAISLRVRALMYSGMAFLLADLIALVIHRSVENPHLLWVGGMSVGATVVVLAAYCERHREQLLQKIRFVSTQLETWR